MIALWVEGWGVCWNKTISHGKLITREMSVLFQQTPQWLLRFYFYKQWSSTDIYTSGSPLLCRLILCCFLLYCRQLSSISRPNGFVSFDLIFYYLRPCISFNIFSASWHSASNQSFSGAEIHIQPLLWCWLNNAFWIIPGVILDLAVRFRRIGPCN